jgi:hypothetical protein
LSDGASKVRGEGLSKTDVGRYILRELNGYHRPGKILDLIPVITDPEGSWLLTVEWVDTPVDQGEVKGLKVKFADTVTLTDSSTAAPIPGTAAAELAGDGSEAESRRGDISTTRWTKLTQSGEHENGMTETVMVRAENFTPSHVGKFIGNSDPESGVNYLIKLLNFRVVNEGSAPGVTMWIRHGEIDGRPRYDDRWHVPFDQEFEFTTITAL